MANCRDIPPEMWAHALDALTRYFSQRKPKEDPEDLAQWTLLRVLRRQDYVFGDPEDFLRVCYGFARHVLQEDRRDHTVLEGDADKMHLQSEDGNLAGMRGAELELFLDQVVTAGRNSLSAPDWKLIWDRAVLGSPEDMPPKEANRLRVQLHRARKKLAILTGWSRNEA
jgi:hypothetical protein